MSSGGMGRITRRRKYRTSFIGGNRRMRFRLNIGVLSLMAGLGMIIASFVRNL